MTWQAHQPPASSPYCPALPCLNSTCTSRRRWPLVPVQGGALLAVTELGGDPTDASTVHFAFQPQESMDTFNHQTHLEIIRQVSTRGGVQQGQEQRAAAPLCANV